MTEEKSKPGQEDREKSEHIYPSWSNIQNYKKAVRGRAPQHLLDPKTRHKIYNSVYWMQYCFGVNLVTFVDRAQMLQGVGGLYGPLKLPCNFLCLFLKLLELEPSHQAILYMLNCKCWQMKHLQLLAAFYVRFTFPCEQVYLNLEPMLQQYNQIAIMKTNGWELSYFDLIIQSFLQDQFWCGVQMPPLTPRVGIEPRISPLSHLINQIHDDVFKELGMDPSGELFEVLEENKKLKFKGGIAFKHKKGKKKKKVAIPSAPQTDNINEIDEDNRIRQMLGLPLLR